MHSTSPNLKNPAGHPGVDWKEAPRLARWWAMDADGQAHWFWEPNVAAFTNFWLSERAAAPDFDYVGDYKQSLTVRPPRPVKVTNGGHHE